MKDRRRSPRIVPGESSVLELQLQRAVDVLDLSAGGTLLAMSSAPASEALVLGELRMSLGPVPFSARMRLCRVERAGRSRVLIGAAFDGLTPDEQQVLDDVLDRASY